MSSKQQEKAFQKIANNLSTIDYIDERLTKFKNYYLHLRDEEPKVVHDAQVEQ